MRNMSCRPTQLSYTDLRFLCNWFHPLLVGLQNTQYCCETITHSPSLRRFRIYVPTVLSVFPHSDWNSLQRWRGEKSLHWTRERIMGRGMIAGGCDDCKVMIPKRLTKIIYITTKYCDVPGETWTATDKKCSQRSTESKLPFRGVTNLFVSPLDMWLSTAREEIHVHRLGEQYGKRHDIHYNPVNDFTSTEWLYSD